MTEAFEQIASQNIITTSVLGKYELMQRRVLPWQEKGHKSQHMLQIAPSRFNKSPEIGNRKVQDFSLNVLTVVSQDNISTTSGHFQEFLATTRGAEYGERGSIVRHFLQ